MLKLPHFLLSQKRKITLVIPGFNQPVNENLFSCPLLHGLPSRQYATKIDYTQPYHVYWEDGSLKTLLQPGDRIQCGILKEQGKYELAIAFRERKL